MTRSLRTLVVAAGLAAAGVAATADRAAAQAPFGFPGGYYSGYTPYGGGGFATYSSGYSTGFASPFGFPGGGYYSSGYQTGYYSAPAFGYGFYPSAPSNVWTGSYYVSPATYWSMQRWR